MHQEALNYRQRVSFGLICTVKNWRVQNPTSQILTQSEHPNFKTCLTASLTSDLVSVI